MNNKILNFDITKGFKAFVNMFTYEEVDIMAQYLNSVCGYDYSDSDSVNMKDDVITDYVKEWLCENVRNTTYDGTQKLFDIVYKVLG